MMLKHPWLLLLFLIYVPVIINYVRRRKSSDPTLEVSTLSALASYRGTWRTRMMTWCFVLRLLAIGCIIVAICRPQKHDDSVHSQIEGTDIVIAMDVSGSMQTNDFVPNRFEASREIASDFVRHRENDNIGIVAFAGESLTYMPLTTDRATVLNTIRMLNIGVLGNGTAIGDGLVSAINRVLGGKAVSKSVILLTDGSNNAGEVDPLMAADIAKQKGVKVYTIGIGSDISQDPYSSYLNVGAAYDLDEETLTHIAKTTGGKYYRATDKESLQQIFKEIDKLEKTKIDADNYVRWQDDFMPWIGAAIVLLLLSLIFRYTWLRRIP
jgi:Ca-activated chloride channel family protein